MKQFLKIFVFTVLLASMLWGSNSLQGNKHGLNSTISKETCVFQNKTTHSISLNNSNIVNVEEDTEFERIVIIFFTPIAFNNLESLIVFTPSLCKVQYTNVIIFGTDNSPPKIA